jgi:hypothetical protein
LKPVGRLPRTILFALVAMIFIFQMGIKKPRGATSRLGKSPLVRAGKTCYAA